MFEDLKQLSEILIVQYEENNLFYYCTQKSFESVEEAQKFIENTDFREETFLQIIRRNIKPSEIDGLTKLINQNLKKLYKVNNYHQEFTNQIQNSWRAQIKEQNEHDIDHFNGLKTHCDSFEKESLAINIIENYQSFLIKLLQRENFIDYLYNPMNFMINNFKQLKMNELKLQFQYEDSLKPFLYSKQIKIIQNLFEKCPSTFIVDSLELEINLAQENKSDDSDQYQNQNQAIIDLTYINTSQVALNIIFNEKDDGVDQLFQDLKLKFKFNLPYKFLKLFVNYNEKMLDFFIQYEVFNRQIIFLDQNRKKMQAYFIPNYFDNRFKLAMSLARFSEYAFDRILSEDYLKWLLLLFYKFNLQNTLQNSLYQIIYDLHLDL